MSEEQLTFEMFENLREILLCSSGDSPRRHPNSAKLRRRPGEVISSQGIARAVTPQHRLPATADAPSWHHHCHGVKNQQVRPQQLRTPSPVQRHWGGCRSPASSVREAFGNSLTYSGAAAIPEDELPGRGLYVSMQRGLGARGTSRPGGMCSSRSAFSSTAGAPSASSRSSQCYTNVAASYEARPDDAIDQLVETHARLLPVDTAKVLILRRHGHGEYEVDGCRVHIAWRGSEACVFPLGDTSQREAGEPLVSFLWRAADAAHARQMARSSCSDLVRARAPLVTACGAPNSGSFLLNSDGSSFLISRDSGSFCSTWMQDDWNEGPHTVRVAAGARSPIRAVGSSTPSASYRTDSQPCVPIHPVVPHGLMGISTPTLPATRLPPPRGFALG